MYLIFAVELRGPFTKKDSKRWDDLNPDRGNRPRYFYVTIRTKVVPTMDALRKTGPPVVKKYGRRVLGEPCKRYKRAGALARQQEMIESLRKQGHVVTNPRPRRTYSVYVFELSPDVGERPAVRRLNPNADPSKPVVYVGQTGKSPEERFKEHRTGKRAGKHYESADCLRLLPRLYAKYNPMTELQSLRTERRLACHLRKEGYTVLGGH